VRQFIEEKWGLSGGVDMVAPGCGFLRSSLNIKMHRYLQRKEQGKSKEENG